MPKESKLKFTNPILESLIFKENPDFQPTEVESQSTSIKMQRSVTKIDEDTHLEKLKVSIDEMDVPYFLEVQMSAQFLLKDVPDEYKKDFLRINAPALLFSYIRPLVTSITKDSKYETVTLPFFNFTTGEIQTEEISEK